MGENEQRGETMVTILAGLRDYIPCFKPKMIRQETAAVYKPA